MTVGNKNQALQVQYVNGKLIYFDKQNMKQGSKPLNLCCIDAMSATPVF